MSPRRNVLLIFLLFLLVPMLPILKVHGAPATIAVDPPISNVTIGDTFNINITVTNIVNFTCWDLKLYFLNGVLNCTEAIEGPFLKTENGTYYGKTITNDFNDTHGQLIAYCTVYLDTNITGSGTILTVTFKAVGGGNSPLHMADIKLGDEKIPPQPIPYTATDGTAQVTSGVGHDVAVTNVTTSKTGCLPIPVVCGGYTARVNVTAENKGDIIETFNVTAYAANVTGSYVIGEQQTTLNPAENKTLTFTWNTTDYAYGNYTVWAYAWPVLGETETADNTFVDGWVIVTIVGDVNGDGKVDLKDVFSVALAYGSYQGHPKYSPNLDINDDDKIDLKDYYPTVLNYGKP